MYSLYYVWCTNAFYSILFKAHSLYQKTRKYSKGSYQRNKEVSLKGLSLTKFGITYAPKMIINIINRKHWINKNSQAPPKWKTPHLPPFVLITTKTPYLKAGNLRERIRHFPCPFRRNCVSSSSLQRRIILENTTNNVERQTELENRHSANPLP